MELAGTLQGNHLCHGPPGNGVGYLMEAKLEEYLQGLRVLFYYFRDLVVL